MQMTVPVQPGNSGGPLVNGKGEVVGVVVSSIAPQGFMRETGTLPQNINFAVSSYYAFPLVKNIPAQHQEAHPKLAVVQRVKNSVCLVVVQE